MLDGLVLFRKGNFCSEVCLWVVFKGGILGGTHQFWGNPYLNNTTILFDSNMYVLEFCQLDCGVL